MMIIQIYFSSICFNSISPNTSCTQKYLHASYFKSYYFNHINQQMNKQVNLQQFVLPLDRNVKSKCEICTEQFGITKREHACKRCCRAVCDDCSPFKVKCYSSDYKNRARRMCRACHIQSEVLRRYVKTNHLKWGEDSDFVKLWLKQLGLRAIPKKRSSDKKKIKQFVTFSELWKSLNFSLREFIGIVIDEAKVSEKEVEELINMGLSELATNKLMDYEHSIYILLFFLAHSNVYNAIYFTTMIHQIVYPEQIALDNIGYFLQRLNCTEIEVYKMESFIEKSFQRIIRRCTVNVFTAEITIQIMGHIIAKREFEELEKGVAFVFSNRKDFICQNANKSEEVYVDILRNLNPSGYRSHLKEMEFNNMSPEKSEKNLSSSGRSAKSDANSERTQIKSQKLQKQNNDLKGELSMKDEEIKRLNAQISKMKQNHNHNGQSSPVHRNSDDMFPYLERNSVELIKSSGGDPYSTQQSGDESAYNSIIQKKNQQIARLKGEVEKVKAALREKEQQSRISQKQKQKQKQPSSNPNEKSKPVLNKDDQIMKLKTENESLKNMNKRLLLKMHELSNLLMDKQEKNITQTNRSLDCLAKSMEKQFSDNEQLKKDCAIF